MSNKNAVKPEDILPDAVNSVAINGIVVRKGSIAAFLANADILENANSLPKQKQAAIEMIKELAPAIIVLNLHKHVVFKNAQIEQILVAAETKKWPESVQSFKGDARAPTFESFRHED